MRPIKADYQTFSYGDDGGTDAASGARPVQRQEYEQVGLRVGQDFQDFERLVSQAQAYLHQGKHDAAAVYVQLAATHAYWKHSGLFASAELERIVLDIGQQIPTAPVGRHTQRTDSPRHVLHVLSQATSIGGHTRMVWRWMQQDAARMHSVVLTRQGALPVPSLLQEAVRARGGQIHVLNQGPGNVLTRAQRLRTIAAAADVSVMHVFADDIVPMMAFQDKQHTPPALFIDQSDHAFWLGGSTSDLVVALRESGARLARERRAIQPERSVLLPIILGSAERTMSRLDAKRRLGINEDSIVLATIARPSKYVSLAGSSFIDAILPVLERYPQVVLLAVGPSNTGEWSEAAVRTQGRVIAVGPQEDTAVYYQAADIYVDSWPMVSITSLLEAGSYGTPVVSRCPYPGECSVLCADTPGLANHLVRVKTIDDYTSTLSRLIEGDALRLQLGTALREDIIGRHCGAGWQQAVEGLYAHACTVPPLTERPIGTDSSSSDDLDTLASCLFRNETALRGILEYQLRGLPLGMRARWMIKLLTEERVMRASLLPPEWLTERLKSWWSIRR